MDFGFSSSERVLTHLLLGFKFCEPCKVQVNDFPEMQCMEAPNSLHGDYLFSFKLSFSLNSSKFPLLNLDMLLHGKTIGHLEISPDHRTNGLWCMESVDVKILGWLILIELRIEKLPVFSFNPAELTAQVSSHFGKPLKHLFHKGAPKTKLKIWHEKNPVDYDNYREHVALPLAASQYLRLGRVFYVLDHRIVPEYLQQFWNGMKPPKTSSMSVGVYVAERLSALDHTGLSA